jgi:CheY-like chemotaxis protein
VVQARLEMGQEKDTQAYARFLQDLRGALNHLYEPEYLRRSPLVGFFGLRGSVDAHVQLQRVLTKAIEALEPPASQPSDTPAHWIYEVLFDRYVQQLSQQEVADQLGVCLRHMRRRQRVALETLAARLWEQMHRGGPAGALPSAAEPVGPALLETGPSLNDELAWLENAPAEAPVALSEVLPSVLTWAQPLAARYDAHVSVAPFDGLPPLAAHPVAVRQMLLSVLSTAICNAQSGQVDISAQLREQTVEIRVRSTTACPRRRTLSEDTVANLEVARELAERSGGALRVATGRAGGPFEATLGLPAALEQLLVLAIDDNPDTLQLLRRYTSNTRYHLIGKRDPEEGFRAAQELRPGIIVLDVMMPQVEGWELLARLQQHPRTAKIPILVCTVLAQKELALSLGARGYARKPITREEFLSALDRLALARATESR